MVYLILNMILSIVKLISFMICYNPMLIYLSLKMANWAQQILLHILLIQVIVHLSGNLQGIFPLLFIRR